MRRGPKPRDPFDRVVEKCLENSDGCWVFTGYLDRKGYGRVTVGSATDGTRAPNLVHRVTYEALRGKIPDGLHLDHLCSNPACCNPWHLEPVTLLVNNRRASARKTHCINGHLYTGENVGVQRQSSNGNPSRYCKECARLRKRAAGTLHAIGL